MLASAIGSAQTSAFTGQCLLISTPLQVRSDGLSERVGDIGLQCSGGVPGAVFQGNLSFFFPASVTNRIDSNNLTRDAAVSVDSGAGPVSSAVPGFVSGSNISFNGVSFTMPATGQVALRISGIRIAAAQLAPSAAPVSAMFSSNLPVNQASVVVAYPQTGLFATLYSTGIPCYGSPSPDAIDVAAFFHAGTNFVSTRFTEGFASAFEVRSPSAGGTRFLVKYSGFPANAHLFVPDFVAGSTALIPTAGGDLGVPQNPGKYAPGSRTLLLARVADADASGAGGRQTGPPDGGDPGVLNGASEVVLSGGTGFAVYEVVDSNPNVQETAQFPTFISLPRAGGAAVAQESVSLAPLSSTADASAAAPVPRFRAATVASDCNTLGDCAASYFPKLLVDALPLAIGAIEKGGRMTTQPAYIPVHNGGGGVLGWNVTFTFQSGSGWLFTDNPSGQGQSSVRVFADTKSLTAGTYQGAVHIDAGSAGSQTVPITLTVTAAPVSPPPPVVVTPAVTVSKVVNAATFGATPLVAGSLGTVLGSHLGGTKVSVTFDGFAAAVLFANDTQINLLVPAALGAKASASVVVEVDGVSSTPFPVALSPAWPSIFAHGVLNQDYQENTSGAAAGAGSVLQIFATGIPKSATVNVQIGDHKDLVPVFAGEAPGFSGLQQVNVQLPSDAVSGDLLVCATAGDRQYCSAPYAVSVK